MLARTRAGPEAGKEKGPRRKAEARQKSSSRQASYDNSNTGSTRHERHQGSSLESSKKRSVRQVAGQQLNELYRLAKHRGQHGVVLDPRKWVFALAKLLDCLEGPRFSRGQHIGNHDGLDFLNLREAVKKCGPSLGADDDLLEEQMNRVLAYHRGNGGARPFSFRKLGRLVQLEREEREHPEVRIKLIESIDEPRAARRARKAEEKRVRDRERQAAIRQGKGCRPRRLFEANGRERQAPWKAEGISRATYYRRLKNAA